MKKDYSSWSKEELVKELKKVEKRKKYGIVWEDKPEDVATLCKEKLPVLEEVKSREIKTDKEKPINIMIEGDNYHALSVLNYTHKGRIDVIYIDPPFNTGSTAWRYNNRYVDREDVFKHSKWLSFMNKRLKLAKNLLSERGILICAIDDYEYHDVRQILDELFNEDNRLGTVVVIHNPGGRQDDKFFATAHEYMLVYARNAEKAFVGRLDISDAKLKEYKFEDKWGRYKLRDFRRSGSNSRRKDRPKLWYPIFVNPHNLDVSITSLPGAVEVLPIDPQGVERVWRWYPKTLLERKEKYIVVQKNGTGYTFFVKERMEDNQGEKPKTFWYKSGYSAANGTNELKKIFGDRFKGEKIFEYPKSPFLIRDILRITTQPKSLVLDFFAGSGTTGQAVLELNNLDNGRRRFILCTNNEIGPKLLDELTEKGATVSEIEKEGICQKICYPRIKAVIEGYEFHGIDSKLIFEMKLTISALRNIDTIFEELEQMKEKNTKDFTSFSVEINDGVLQLYGIFEKTGMQKGVGGNFKYFKTDFVDAEPTDANKKKMVDKSTEMLCLREDCFDEVKKNHAFRIFTNAHGKNLGIIYDDDGIEPFKKEIKKLKKKFVVYVFSLDDSAREEEFDDIANLVELKPIPAVILNVYRRIFK